MSETLTPQIMTGIRGTTPVLFGNMTAFGSFSAGYGHWIDFEEGGFAYEAQIGLNITSKLYAAFVYENQGISWEEEGYDFDADVSFTGLRLGLRDSKIDLSILTKASGTSLQVSEVIFIETYESNQNSYCIFENRIVVDIIL